jgi:hypothetical protein
VEEDLEEDRVDPDSESADLPIADAPSVGIQYRILVGHHALA